jgi:hypothetical protein
VNSHVVVRPAQGAWFWGSARIARHLPVSTSARETRRAISQPGPELIRAGFDAFNRGDYETWIAGCAKDVEFHDLGETPNSGTGVGSSVPIEMTVYVALRFSAGRVGWTNAYTDRAEALEAAGLRE